ncbi:MAG: hypothetical protein DHS20C17_13270 [Cyclobacteriaceae bacterium]|nr:MAG: hypothetical protein DHS20C17_13270 [Cyclobacteriaceae bacterium]
MKKNKLIANVDFDFSLLAISSLLKEYKLAWILNQQLGIHLIKQPDEVFHFLGNDKLCISNYLYRTEHTRIRLLFNRSREETLTRQYLIPELKQFDYLMLVEGFEDSLVVGEIREKIKKIIGIQMVNPVEVEHLKSRENLIF